MDANSLLSIDDVGQPARGLTIAAISIVDHRNNRRDHPRTKLVRPCLVVPVDIHNNPTAEPYTATTVDICTSGIGLLQTDPIEPQLIFVVARLSSQKTIRFIADIVRCGNVNGYFRIGAKLIQKFDALDSPLEW